MHARTHAHAHARAQTHGHKQQHLQAGRQACTYMDIAISINKQNFLSSLSYQQEGVVHMYTNTHTKEGYCTVIPPGTLL